MSARVADVFGRPDEEIRRAITEKIIIREFRADPALVTVTVTDGVVTLDSTPETATIGHEIAGEVRHMEGVVAVHERVGVPSGRSAGGAGGVAEDPAGTEQVPNGDQTMDREKAIDWIYGERLIQPTEAESPSDERAISHEGKRRHGHCRVRA